MRGMRPADRNLAGFLVVVAVMLAVYARPPVARAAIPIPGSVATTSRVVALTFDDGPSPYTAPILKALETYGAHATFFEIGDQVAGYASTVRAIVRAGDELGNHTYTHPDLQNLSNAAVAAQFQETQDVIRRTAGVTPRWFHPPYADVDDRIVQIAAGLGLRPVLWSVDPRDWALPGTNAIVQNVLANVRPGSIVLLHDGGGNRSETLAALPAILQSLRAAGYTFVTVSRLFNLPSQPVQPVCPTARAQEIFGRDGVVPAVTHAIYRTWLQRYCSGNNLGPATSDEYTLVAGVVAQNFVATAHRIEWTRSTGAVHVRLIWPWAIAAFSRLGIQPRWPTPITHAWFDHYFHDQNWGAARTEPSVKAGATVQCFEYGCATLRNGIVTWQKT